MNVILTSICCGKTYLTKVNRTFIDLDIFANVKTWEQRKIAFSMIYNFAKKADDTKIYLFNIDRFEKLELYKISEIKIIKIILAKDYEFRRHIFIKRDMEEYGATRLKKLNLFEESFSKIEKLGSEYSQKYNVPLQFLENGKFLSDVKIQKKRGGYFYDYFYSMN